MSTTRSSAHGKQIIGYITQYDGWKDVAGLVTPGSFNQLNVKLSNYTMLNFSFFGLAKNGTLHSADYRNKNIWQKGAVQEPAPLVYEDVWSSYDPFILYGSSGIPGNNADGLVKLAHNAGVKVMASLGGWSMSKHFCEVAKDPGMRSTLISQCADLITRFDFDGIDFDWEYPGAAGMNIEHYSDDDYENFAIVMEELRVRLDQIKPNLLITAAMSADPNYLEKYDWDRLQAVMDYFNIMTYDFNGGWSDKAGHNAPLYEYPNAERPLSIDTVTQYLKRKNVAMAKVNLGVAFYGRGVITRGPAALNAETVEKTQPETNTPGFEFQPDGPILSCGDFVNWKYFDATPFYSAIMQKTEGGGADEWVYHFDPDAKVPYLTKDNYFLSYDNERSVSMKAQYVVNQGCAGVIIWNVFGEMQNLLEGQYLVGNKLKKCPNTTYVLSDAINDTFNEAKR
ncbi:MULTISPECIES: glycosyl hydrolase family 18 protein [unclassified Burkholderia]|uniref:glycoside hydrolase family 18 protein n=1 Tax=unclassified Burkholderia TaxID=2613784 RepID=UPI0009EA44E5|nr:MULTISPECIES: glycosyl hydrolase family 18 protein [unclassified Burkholderia]